MNRGLTQVTPDDQDLTLSLLELVVDLKALHISHGSSNKSSGSGAPAVPGLTALSAIG